MTVFRITVQVTLDIEEQESGLAVSKAIDQVRERIGDDQDGADHMWVTGVARDATGLLVFAQD
jgi:hypothetical protein